MLYHKGEKLECNLEHQCNKCEWESLLYFYNTNGTLDYEQPICKANMCAVIYPITETTRCRKFTKRNPKETDYERRSKRYNGDT